MQQPDQAGPAQQLHQDHQVLAGQRQGHLPGLDAQLDLRLEYDRHGGTELSKSQEVWHEM